MNAAPSDSSLPFFGTLPSCVSRRARRHGDRTAITFLSDGYFSDDEAPETWTYGQLWEHASTRARRIRESLAESGSAESQSPRVLLLYPAGVEFLLNFLAAQMAGCIPVPTAFPRPHREIPRLNAAGRDCQPSLILTDRATRETLAVEKLDPTLRNVPIVATDSDSSNASGTFEWDDEQTSPDSIAFLQYTSGSTSDPNGVIVRQRNLMSNLESIRHGFDLSPPPDDAVDGDPRIDVGVFWLPFYHDMGLIGGILEPLYIGGHSVLMSPRAFLQRPIRWLQTISDFQSTISGAPNFAYQLCVDRIPPDQTDQLSLASWRLAFCGAEPITPKTLIDFESRFASNGFSKNAFYPCYGLAEATLLVAGTTGPKPIHVLSLDRSAYQAGRVSVLPERDAKKAGRRERQDLVACGSAVKHTEIAIVDPQSLQPLGEDAIGEIWVRGDGVADGYWSEPDSAGTNDPSTVDQPQRFDASHAGGPSGFCRSGDLGFFHEGSLYITGRVKELVILRGRNLYPQDIENTTEQAIRRCLAQQAPSADVVHLGNIAAFSVPSTRGESLAILAEMPRGSGNLDYDQLVREIRREIIEDHEVDPQHIWLVRLASIPVTTSGKIRRGDCRDAFQDASMKTLYRFDRASFSEQAPIAFPVLPTQIGTGDSAEIHEKIESWMSEWLIARAGVAPTEFLAEKPLGDYGLDSLTAVELSGETEDWTGVALTPDVAVANPSVKALSRYVAERYLAQRAL